MEVMTGHVIPDRFFLPCQVVPSMSFARGQELFLGPNISSCTSIASYSRSLPLLCQASSNSSNARFSRIYKGSPRTISWQNLERERPFNPDGNFLLSNNGPPVSPSSKRRPSAPATPEQKREIIELFRRVQAQLRERTAKRKEMKFEVAQQGQKDRVGGGSFFKLQTLTHGRNRGSEDSYDLDQPSKFDSLDHPEQSDPFELEQNSSFFELNNLSAEEDTSDGEPSLKSNQKPKPEIELPAGHLSEDNHERPAFESFVSNWVVNSHPSDSSDADETNKEISESYLERGSDLNAMTMVELKSLAKSRGLRGYSKLRRSLLLEMLERS